MSPLGPGFPKHTSYTRISQCPARKTETTSDISNGGNLIQGVVYTGDGAAQEPNKGAQETTQITESAGAAGTPTAKHRRPQSGDPPVGSETRAERLSGGWDQGGRGELVAQTQGKVPEATPTLERASREVPLGETPLVSPFLLNP